MKPYELLDIEARASADDIPILCEEIRRLQKLLDSSTARVESLESICPWCAGNMKDGTCQTCSYTRLRLIEK